MTFEDAVWIGLGLKVTPDNVVTTPAAHVSCGPCRAEYLTTQLQDMTTCRYCNSADVQVMADINIVKEKRRGTL